MVENSNYVLFWGYSDWGSQWYSSNFIIDGVRYNCAEQFMMAEKARFFGDTKTLNKIMKSSSPKEQKSLGRLVKPFDEGEWYSVCREPVYKGNLAKFSQNKDLKEIILNTGNKTLVEASPVDKIWGIGRSEDDPLACTPSAWRGKNWLGEALMRVRKELRNSTNIGSSTLHIRKS